MECSYAEEIIHVNEKKFEWLGFSGKLYAHNVMYRLIIKDVE
jgi:hypothetical protein